MIVYGSLLMLLSYSAIFRNTGVKEYLRPLSKTIPFDKKKCVTSVQHNDPNTHRPGKEDNRCFSLRVLL